MSPASPRPRLPSISRSGDRIQSPTANGRSRKILKPPRKLASKSRAAKPTAMPPTPPNANRPDTDTPKDCRIMIPATTQSTMRLSLATALIVARALDSSNPRCSPNNSSSIPRLKRCGASQTAPARRYPIVSATPRDYREGREKADDSKPMTTHITHCIGGKMA